MLLTQHAAKIDRTWHDGALSLLLYVKSNQTEPPVSPTSVNVTCVNSHSCVEANLLIICASCFTVRQFAEALTPMLLTAAKSTRFNFARSAPTSKVQVFNVGNAGSQGLFDGTDTGMGTTVTVQGLPPRRFEEGQSWGHVVEVGNYGSQRGISQTRTIHVYHEYRQHTQ